MSGYIPRTGSVRVTYIHGAIGSTKYEGKADLLGSQFDHWLAEHVRQVSEQAWEQGYRDCCAGRGIIPNPYKGENK